MAEFFSIDKDKYKIVGVLNEEDIDRINSFRNRTTLILDNTVGLSSELISKIKSNLVVFSIKGGLDYDTKEKYKEEKYVDRTFVSPSGLKNIIKYFEYNERLIDPNWNKFEIAMFLYNALVVDMEYGDKYEDTQPTGKIERGLNGILYGKLVCSGFAQVYKEMLDRVGIKCYYQNQQNVHSFNVIEIDGKKYGVDVTWDNNDKKRKNGKCSFVNFANDPDFYNRAGHILYTEEDDFDLDGNWVTKKVYDKDEEVFDLSILSKDQLKEFYNHISSKIDSRKSFKYNLQDQSLDIKNKYLPVDTVNLKLKQEAAQELPIIFIINFLKKRDALQIDSQLIKTFAGRKGYILDIADSDAVRFGSVNLSLIGFNNYKINDYGTVTFNDGNEMRYSALEGINADDSNMSQDELNTLYNNLNMYLNQYFNKYISHIVENLDNLLAQYEYKPDEWDSARATESGNIYSKLSMIVNGKDYLIQLGMSEQDVESIIQRINDKYMETHKPYESVTNKKDNDLDFLAAVFGDSNMVREVIEYDLQKQITEEEFTSLYGNVDYMIKLFEEYITIAGDEKFKFDDYDISKDDLQQLLNKIIQDYHKNEMLNESIELDENQNLEIHK